MKVRRPPIRPPYFYAKTGEDNPYLYDDFDYWQVNSLKPRPLPKTWILELEKQPQVFSEGGKKPNVPKLPKILSRQGHFRSNSAYKSGNIINNNN